MLLAQCRRLFLLLSLIAASSLYAATSTTVDQLLAEQTAPAGVVFEIVEWEDDALASAIPNTIQQIQALRQRFPELPVAVVSHGQEQFALMHKAENAYPEIHQLVKTLDTDHGVEIELCLGHAHMKGYDATDFPDYVSIDGSGPARIADYQSQGYQLVIVGD